MSSQHLGLSSVYQPFWVGPNLKREDRSSRYPSIRRRLTLLDLVTPVTGHEDEAQIGRRWQGISPEHLESGLTMSILDPIRGEVASIDREDLVQSAGFGQGDERGVRQIHGVIRIADH